MADTIMNDTIDLDTTNAVLNERTDARYPSIIFLLLLCQCTVRWFFLGLQDTDTWNRKALKSTILC